MRSLAFILCGALASAAAVDVPLAPWTDPAHPGGLSFGGTMGISFGDYDGDGYPDVFACWSGKLWRNVAGSSWELAADLSTAMPPTERRYGSSFGDYDGDGLPDIAAAPRVPYWGDDRFHLLHNGGGTSFADVASDPSIVDVQPYGNTETLCWADVDADGDLDLFVPAYPAWEGGPGNFFLRNDGGTFHESSAEAGLDNPPGTARPEGAQLSDLDGDGDADLYANGTLYQNVSTPGAPAFRALDEAASGIGLSSALDEGAMAFDYDLDGDFDVIVAYASEGVRIWESRGDGTFFPAETAIVDAPLTGVGLGLSAADWDDDGDVDFTTREVFRRNRLIEDGARHFTVATTSIPLEDRSSATPAWGDWDRDGDLDCALGNWGDEGHLYESTLYASATPAADRRDLAVRAVREARGVPRGLETEYGAVAELRVTNAPDPYRRRAFVASSHGYLNQNAYPLHFGLPAGARVDVSVDFPGDPAQGLARIDARTNPALAGVDPAALADREITITRCGSVVVDGVAHDPIPLASPLLATSAGGLALPSPGLPLPAPSPSPQADWYAGLAFETSATDALVLREIVLDGQLDAPSTCPGGSRNIALWDVTDAAHPALVPDGALSRTTSSRNRRTSLPVDIALQPGHAYRLVARVTESRTTTIAAPVTSSGLTVLGGLSFRDQNGCTAQRTVAALADPTKTALALRYATVPADTRLDPVGPSLRLWRDAAGTPTLTWRDAGAAAYRVLRCSASAGPCAPALLGQTSGTAYADGDVTPAPGEAFWYQIRAINACQAEASTTP